MDATTSTLRRLYTTSISIGAPVGEVFDYLKDPTRSWAGMGLTLHDVKPAPEGLGTTFGWEDKMFGFHVSGINEITEFVPNERLVVTASKGFVWRFDLEPEGSGTKLTLGLDEIPSNWAREAFDAVATRLSERELDDWLGDLKATLESGVPQHREVERHLVLSLAVTINAPVGTVYTFLADPQVVLGSCPGTRVTDVVINPEVVGTTSRWHSRILGVPAAAAMRYVAAVPSQGVTLKSSSGFVQRWELQPAEGGTRLTLWLENELSGPVGAVLRSTMLRLGDTSMDLWLERLAALIEERAAS